MSDEASLPVVSVVIPVHNGGATLSHCLRALRRTTYTSWEVIVVDDGSSDGSAQIAAARGARVLRNVGAARGPAWARNAGARQASGEVLVFLDADVAVRGETVAQLVEALQKAAVVAACFGSYDAQPAAENFLSQYKNLQHHFTHQSGQEEATTFWAGCGAVYRDPFWRAGGFDEAFVTPSVEDIELGLRLRALGYSIRLAPQIQVTHLKQWDALSLLRSDVLQRALPWSRLIARQRTIPHDLNLAHGQRASAVAAWTGLASLGLLARLRLTLVPLLLSVVALWTLNARFYRFLLESRGLRFLLRALPWHWLYFLYSSMVFALVWLKVTVCDLFAAHP